MSNYQATPAKPPWGGTIIAGMAVILVTYVLQQHYLATAHTACTSTLGAIAQGLSQTASTGCTKISDYWSISQGALFVGFILVVIGFVRVIKGRPQTPQSPASSQPQPPLYSDDERVKREQILRWLKGVNLHSLSTDQLEYIATYIHDGGHNHESDVKYG